MPCHAINEELGRVRLDLVWLCGYQPILGKLAGVMAFLPGCRAA